MRLRLPQLVRRAPLALPIPPPEMRALVGPTDPAAFDNPSRSLVFPDVEEAAYTSVFDFGCGCGRLARQLMQQNPRPARYVGVDLHRGMIEWCKTNLAPFAPGFEFHHHDVFNFHFNPGAEKPDVLALPAADSSHTLVTAFSVFTHLTEVQAGHYMREVARILSPSGVFHSTWFLFDKSDFPMLQPHTNALYVSYVDPSSAVLFAREWLRATAREVGLTITGTVAPDIRGYQWVILMSPVSAGKPDVELPPDDGVSGFVDLPPMPENANRIGTE